MLAATGFRISEGDIFVLSFTGDSPQEAQRVTAKLTDVLIAENTRLRSAQAEVAQAFLETEKRRNETELAAREAELLRFLASHPEFAQDHQGAGGLVAAREAEGQSGERRLAGCAPARGDCGCAARSRPRARLPARPVILRC